MPYPITSTQISDFFKGRRAQERLPELIRRLIFAQHPNIQIKRCRFPSGDAVKEHGFDGYVTTHGEDVWVHDGESVWEVGTDEDPKTKANKDWKAKDKRKWPKPENRKDYIWIFVTPHFWPEQDRQPWIEEKEKESIWKKIIAYDATDLETWLDQSPNANTWLAKEMGISSVEIFTIEEYLDTFIPERNDKGIENLYEKKSELIIAGRNVPCQKLQKWFTDGGKSILLLGESLEEGELFASSALCNMTSIHETNSVSSRIMCVKTREAVQIAEKANGEIILIPVTNEAETAALASRNKNVRVIRRGIFRAVSPEIESNFINLGYVRRYPVEAALIKLGYELALSRTIAKESKGSLQAVLWALKADSGQLETPWEGDISIFTALWLSGQWDKSNKNDIEIIEILSNKKWNDIEKIIINNTGRGKIFEQFGNMIDWKSWPACLQFISPALTETFLNQFKDCLLYVLTETDPETQMQPDERWLAGVREIRHPYSKYLREGLISSLVLLGIHSKELSNSTFDISHFVKSILREILLDPDRENLALRWCSLAKWLGDFAEADPDIFLEAALKLVEKRETCSMLFGKHENPMFSSSYHCNLLWALERLAWLSDYLKPVVNILAILDEQEHEYSVSNTPVNSLKDIFLPWHPSTLADFNTKCKIFLSLADNHPTVAWKLACGIRPSSDAFTSGTNKPRWHYDWEVPENVPVTRKEYHEFSQFIIEWMIEQGEKDPLKMPELITSFPDWRVACHPDVAKNFIAKLFDIAESDLKPEVRKKLYDALRKFISHHRGFPEADWCLDEDTLKKFEKIQKEFEPEDALSKNIWLFDSWPQLPLPRKEMSFEEQDKLLDEKRLEAINEIYSQQGLETIFDAVTQGLDTASQLGLNLSKLNLKTEEVNRIIIFGIKTSPSEDPNYKAKQLFLKSYVAYQKYNNPDFDNWTQKIFDSDLDWDNSKRVNFALTLPATNKTWRMVESWGKRAKKLYWQEVQYNRLENPKEDLQIAAFELLDVSRPCEALDTIYMALHRNPKDAPPLPIDNDVIIEAIKKAPIQGSDVKVRNVILVAHTVSELLGYLETHDVSDQELAQLEWPWMSGLEPERRGIKSLKKTLSKDPVLFVDILKLIFRAENEEPRELNEADQQRAQMGFRLLMYWDNAPGTTYTDTPQERREAERDNSNSIHFRPGSVNYQELLDYCNRARELAKNCGRLEVCDSKLGNVLAHSPKGEDGDWPHKNVCKVITEIASEASESLERGIHIGVINKRGAHHVAPDGSGEHAIANQFRKYLKARQEYPRVFKILNNLITDFESQEKYQQGNERYREFWD